MSSPIILYARRGLEKSHCGPATIVIQIKMIPTTSLHSFVSYICSLENFIVTDDLCHFVKPRGVSVCQDTNQVQKYLRHLLSAFFIIQVQLVQIFLQLLRVIFSRETEFYQFHTELRWSK